MSLNHYWIDYSCAKGDYTIIESTNLNYKDAEAWAKDREPEDLQLQIWDFKEISGIGAAILDVINWR